jgi:hypothetical protein
MVHLQPTRAWWAATLLSLMAGIGAVCAAHRPCDCVCVCAAPYGCSQLLLYPVAAATAGRKHPWCFKTVTLIERAKQKFELCCPAEQGL